MKYINWVSLGLIGLAMALPAVAGDSAEKLDRKVCSVCHGIGGATSSELFPQLAGQPSLYLTNQMKAFRDKSRSDENARRFMWGISAKLNDEDIQNLAMYYASKPATHIGKITDETKYEQGKNIFLNGHAEKGVPACQACHGEKGEGKEAVPRLGGQHAAYLKRQLSGFSGNERPAATAMHQVVKGLSKDDIEAMAQYLQAQ
jgi:cytochrome c553